MIIIKFFLILLVFCLNACSTLRESAGVNRKSIDEFMVVENPPLVIPPDFNLLPPNQLKEKNIDNIERELAQEILFGLDAEEKILQKNIGTMNQILKKAQALDISNSIRDEIDEDFSQEIKTDGIFQINHETEVEVLDAVKESKRIRNKNFEGTSISEGDVPTKNSIIKNRKKKKRFFIF